MEFDNAPPILEVNGKLGGCDFELSILQPFSDINRAISDEIWELFNVNYMTLSGVIVVREGVALIILFKRRSRFII
jgi:hypothetical protein